MKYYNSIDSLPIWNFNKIGETNDLRYLLRDETAKVTDLELETVYHKIITEYRDATAQFGDNSLILDVQKQILSLKTKYTILKLSIFNANFDFDSESIKTIEDCGYKIDQSISLSEQLFDIDKRVANLETQWIDREIELQQLTKKDNKNKVSFEQYVWRISDIKGYKLDTKTISVREWLALEANLIEDENRKTLTSYGKGK